MSRVLCLIVCLFFNADLLAENWPCWRGPRGDGTSAETQIPVKWNGETGEGIAWKVAIPGKGHSSPIVWEDRVFVTTCIEESRERALLCLNGNDGKLLWQSSVAVSQLEKKHSLNSFASGTPATDGKTVYVTFLVAGNRDDEARAAQKEASATAATLLVVAYDMQGKKIWSAEPGGFASVHGFCSSPVIYKDLLIINGDHDGDSYVAALSRKTGETMWKVPREHKTRSYQWQRSNGDDGQQADRKSRPKQGRNELADRRADRAICIVDGLRWNCVLYDRRISNLPCDVCSTGWLWRRLKISRGLAQRSRALLRTVAGSG